MNLKDKTIDNIMNKMSDIIQDVINNPELIKILNKEGYYTASRLDDDNIIILNLYKSNNNKK